MFSTNPKIQPGVKAPSRKLYAGDITPYAIERGFFGLSITKETRHQMLADMTQALPFPENSITHFQSEDVFEHIAYEKMPPVLDEIYRILAPGGIFCMSVPDYHHQFLIDRSEKDADGNIVFDEGGGGTREKPGHVWFPTLDLVLNLIQNSNFYPTAKIKIWEANINRKEKIVQPFDHSLFYIQRSVANDPRCKDYNQPISIILTLTK